MSFDRIPIVNLLFISSFLLLALAYITFVKRKSAGNAVIYLSVGFIATSIYSFGYAMELVSQTLPQVMTWVKFEHWGIQLLAPMWLLFTLYITGKEKIITTRFLILILFIPIIMLVCSQTLGNLNLLHRNPHLEFTGGYYSFAYEKTTLMYIDVFMITIYLIISFGLYTAMLIKTAPAFRIQYIFFWIASFVPFIAQLIYNFGFSTNNLDLTPISLAISCLIFSFGFLQFGLLNIVPFARDLIFESLSDGILVIDNQNRIVDFNPRVQMMLPQISKKVIGDKVETTLSNFPNLVSTITKQKTGTIELETREKQYIRTYLVTITAIEQKKDLQIGRIINLHDNTQTRQLFNQLEELATKDSLTETYNRRSFTKLAEDIISDPRISGKTFAMIMIDLDKFKSINDRFGHAAGDDVLQSVTKVCKSILRQTDIFGRYGGEEFVILLPDINANSAMIIAERLRSKIENTIITRHEDSITTTASFGVAVFETSKDRTLDEVLVCADQALYKAKKLGRNHVCLGTDESQ